MGQKMRTAYLNFLIVLVTFYFGCSDNEPSSYSYSEPYIRISNPVINSSVPDSTTVEIVSNIDDLIRVELYIDQSIPSSDAVFKNPPYKYLWNTMYYADGSQHILQAKGYDSKGNSTSSKYVIVNVYRFRPSNLQAVLKADSLIELNWMDNCSYETGFEIEEAVNDSNFTKIGEVDSNIVMYSVVDTFSLNNVYYFRVRAKANDDFSGYSNIAAATVELYAPVNLDIDFISDTAAVFSWTDNNDFESEYLIQKHVPGHGYYYVKSVPANTSETVVLDTFKAGDYYDYLIYPVLDNTFGPPAHFPYKEFKFPPPYDVKLQGIDFQTITLNWNDNNSYELGFIIERSSDGINYHEIGKTAGHSFTDTYLDTTLEYKYRIAAYSRYNQSDYSDETLAFYESQLSQVNKFQINYGISWAVLSYDASIIAFGGYVPDNVAVYVYSTFTGAHLNTLMSADSTSRIFEQLTISPDNRLLAAAGDNNYITIWNINSGQVVKRIYNQAHPYILKFSYDGNYLIVERGGGLRFYDIQTWMPDPRINNINIIKWLDINSDQSVIATADYYNDIRLWDYNTGSLIREIPGTVNAYPILFNRKGDRLYSVIFNELFAWDVNSGSTVLDIPDFWRIRYFAVNESRNIAASGYSNPGIGIWQLSSGYRIQELALDPGIRELFFTPDNNYLIGSGIYQYYYIWEIVKGWTSPM